MAECRYCGNDHAPTDLCRARRVNRRSFFGVFAAGLAGLALAPQALTWKDRLWDMPAGVESFGALQLLVERSEVRFAFERTRLRWVEIADYDHLLIPARDLAPSGRSRSARLTSIPIRD